MDQPQAQQERGEGHRLTNTTSEKLDEAVEALGEVVDDGAKASDGLLETLRDLQTRDAKESAWKVFRTSLEGARDSQQHHRTPC